MTNFNAILALASKQLPSAGIECILIGGFAVNYYGYTRNTLDVDFMILGDNLDRVKQIMLGAGFSNVSIRENVAFFNQPGFPLRVDFLHTDTHTMQALYRKSVAINLHGYTIRVPALRDLIAMKIFALAGDSARRMGKDLPDISYLTTIHDLDLESEIRPLCDQFGDRPTYELIKTQVEALRTT
jgi:hypothetical protein